MNFKGLVELIKAIGKDPIMEIVKNKWVQFCVGTVILLLRAPSFVRALAEALK